EAYADSYAARGLSVAVVALGSVYGPRQDPLGCGLVARAAWSMLQGEPPRIEGDGRQERDWVYVDDAVDALARAVRSDVDGRLLVGTGSATSVLEVVERLAARTGWRGEPDWAPARQADPRRCALDPARTAKLLGWHPWTELDEGLTLSVEWLRSRLPARPRYTGI
ncbi:MAG TPA: NAD-dependent epimerase/dehydratase family protein, partial [Actinomycetes bacterium]